MIASLLFALQLGVTADRPSTDRWIAPDKVEHYAASALIETSAYAALRKLKLSNGRALAGATAVTIAAGVGKELLDRRRGFTISGKDLVWDFAGVSSMFELLRRRGRLDLGTQPALHSHSPTAVSLRPQHRP